MALLALNLKEALLVVFVAIALLKQRFLDQPTSEVSSQSHANQETQVVLSQPDVQAAAVDAVAPSRTVSQSQGDDSVACGSRYDLGKAFQKQLPVVLQNMSNKAAYNGHVGRIVNCSKSRLLVSVHGVFFDAEPAEIWVKPRHLRLLEAPAKRDKRLDLDTVKVRASSTRGDFPLDSILQDNDRKWWISKPGSFSKGRGEEYLEFEFSSSASVRVVGISIPPMPMGPLSVREFAVDAYVDQKWVSLTPVLQTLDLAGLQEVAVDVVKSRRLRVKCFSSSAPMDMVGLFQVAFF